MNRLLLYYRLLAASNVLAIMAFLSSGTCMGSAYLFESHFAYFLSFSHSFYYSHIFAGFLAGAIISTFQNCG